MRVNVEELPDWNVEIREVSAGVYNVKAVHPSGMSIDLTDTDPEALLERAKESARGMLQQVKHRFREP
jgi:hypothetical protein